MATPIYKVVFMGDGGVGKSTLLQRHVQNTFQPIYKPTFGAEVHPIQFQTNHGPVVLNIWDTAGQEKYSGLQEGYNLGAHHNVIFYSVNSKLSARNISYWSSLAPSIPSTIVGTKSNLPNKTGLDTPLVNAKTGEGITAFWQELLATLTGHADIFITE